MYLLILHREERYTPKVGLLDVNFMKYVAGIVCSWGDDIKACTITKVTLSADDLAKRYLASKKIETMCMLKKLVPDPF